MMQGLRHSFVLLVAILVSQKAAGLGRSRGGPFRAMFPRVHHDIQPGQDYGDPLFLTPYLEQGMAEKARTLSEVNLPNTTVNSYSGYLTVNKTDSSNLFFWFFPALSDPENAPVLLWLEGGPGATSMYGVFTETGPFYITQDAQLMNKKVTWASAYSMLYIDNPVGTGFSFTKSDAGFATNQGEVADNLYNALLQFYQIYTDFHKNDFYITGESYAGKYVPALSYKIHMENPTAKFKINFKGMAIGDGLCDPINQYPALPAFLYNTGLCDENQAKVVSAAVTLMQKLISDMQYMEAFKTFDELLNGDVYPYPSYFYNITGGTNYFNYLRTVEPPEQEYFWKYLARPEVRKAIHVGNLTFHDGSEVEKHLLSDVMKSVAPWVATIMENYKVLIYNGQLDVIVAGPLTENFLWSLPWSGLQQYQKSDRTVWKINPSDTEVAGFVRQVGNFYQVIVKGGGHILPFDQPERAFDMIDRFVSGRGFQ
ncbi:PREDICTED: probable serine carboxypeptidase CPVL [Branchiostoma belcheri]|uniref:Carboxypeptidase n=1 Tax=Branchiostoma belcheri TaxID=7741 RepID=A0A6P4YFI9_BRABE|nr:PREDICTED: probable serine carboxypeptidase CPVL [Branchiostoma belcheri]XP_019617542.1 PREDICTED: probable serine carboxypeptidase CPVL [Branchiostoma belcheri]